MAYRTVQPMITEQINAWNVTALEVQTRWQEPPWMQVILAYGYDAGDGGGVRWLRDQAIDVPTEVLTATWSQHMAGVSIFEAVAGGIYAWLRAEGHIPAAAVWTVEDQP